MTGADQKRTSLALLQRMIDGYERGTMALGTFLQEFDGLISRLEPLSPACAGRLKGEWWTIEQIFAASMDPELQAPADQDRLIREALENAKAILEAESTGAG